MKIEICISIISAVIAACSFTLPLVINCRHRKRDKQASFDNRLDTIIKLGIEYPYFENKTFTKEWTQYKDNQNEKYLRYDNYCNIVFNFLHSVCEYYKYDKRKIENYIDIKNWIRMHEDNWANPIDPHENIDGYDEKFRTFINAYLK